MAYVLGSKIVKDTQEFASYAYGITLPIKKGNTGYFEQAFTSFEQAKANLKNLLLTAKGERVMQPDFGCDIWKLIFEPIIRDDIDSKIEFTINEAVKRWLPYLNIDEIIFDYDDASIDKHVISLDLTFSLISNPNLTETIQVNVNN